MGNMQEDKKSRRVCQPVNRVNGLLSLSMPLESDSYRRVAQPAGDVSSLNVDTILYAPGMQAAAQELVDSGEGYGACDFLCMDEPFSGPASPGNLWFLVTAQE